MGYRIGDITGWPDGGDDVDGQLPGERLIGFRRQKNIADARTGHREGAAGFPVAQQRL